MNPYAGRRDVSKLCGVGGAQLQLNVKAEERRQRGGTDRHVARWPSTQTLVCVCWPETSSWGLRLLWTQGQRRLDGDKIAPPLTFPQGSWMIPLLQPVQEKHRTEGWINTGRLAKTGLT